jgi:hypothetical protein
MTEKHRRILWVLSGACWVLASVCLLAWISSYFTACSICVPCRGRTVQLELHRGGIHLIILDAAPAARWFGRVPPTTMFSEPAAPYHIWPAANLPAAWDHDVIFGFALLSGVGFMVIRIPLWALVLLLIAFPIWWRRYPRRLRRVPFGICPQCGYDLRASTERCPECGRIFTEPILDAKPPPRVQRSDSPPRR